MINVPVSIAALLIYVYVSGFLNRNLLRIEAKPDDITNIFTYTGFVNRDGSRLDNNDVNVLVPSTTVEVWNRVANRSFNETPLGDIKFIRQYNIPCDILTLSEFLEGRNNLLQTLITSLKLTQLDWQNFVNDLINTITSKNPDGTFIYSNSDRRLAITRLTNFINDSRSYQDGKHIPIPGSFYGGVLSGAWTDQTVAQRIQDELPKALFKQCQTEFIIPLVCQVYPNPVLVDPDTGSPTCEDGYIGVCCLYDTTIESIRPGLVRNVKIYKKCLENIDEADCLNQTKTFTQSLIDATYGQYEGAEFYSLDERAEAGCETCKNPVSVVYCSDGVPFIIKDKKTWEIALELVNAFQPTNIAYFNSSRAANTEFLRRNSQNSCSNASIPTPTLPTETPTLPTETPTTPTPEPVPGFPVSVTLDNFSGLAENCSNYNGIYTVYQPFIDGNPAEYNYTVDPPNSYSTDAAVKVGYSPNSGDIYVCLYVATPGGDAQLCQSYDIDWSTGNYAVQNGFPSTPWCTGDINLDINI